MGLDWDAPAYSDHDPAERSSYPLLSLKVDLGPLPLTASVDPRVTEPLINDLEAAYLHNPGQPGARGRLARRCNDYAWSLANAPGMFRNPERALTLARRALELVPNQPTFTNTLGVVQYRAGLYTEAIATLDRSLALGHGTQDGYDRMFQAMAHWRLGDKPKALACFGKALEWIERNPQFDEDLVGFRAEASALLGQDAKRD
jgi:Flp pilus assembly protein TadD